MKLQAAIILSSCVAILAGCGEQITNGVVVDTGKSGLSFLSKRQLVVRNEKGREVNLRTAGGPVYVLAFVRAGADVCEIHPTVRRLADDLYVHSVPVVQVNFGAAGLPESPADLQQCGDPGKNIIRLFDPDSVALGRYGRPEDGTVLLIDQGFVHRRKTLRNTEWLVHEARELIEQWETEQTQDASHFGMIYHPPGGFRPVGRAAGRIRP